MRALFVGCLCLVCAVVGMASVTGTMEIAAASRSVADLLHAGGSGRAELVIVLQQQDCFGDAAMLRRWQSLAEREEMVITGRLIDNEEFSSIQRAALLEAGLFLEAEGVSRKDAARVAARLGLRATPFAVILDPEGRLSAVLHSSKPPAPADAP